MVTETFFTTHALKECDCLRLINTISNVKKTSGCKLNCSQLHYCFGCMSCFSRQVHDFGEVFSTAVLDRKDEYNESRNNFTEVIISSDIFLLGS